MTAAVAAAAVAAAMLVGFAGQASAQGETGEAVAEATAAPAAETVAATVTEPEEAGIVIVAVDAGGPAAAAGLARGDILLAVNGEPINDVNSLVLRIASAAVGDVWTLTVRHGDEERSLEVTLGERDGRPFLGLRPYAEVAAMEGVVVHRINPMMAQHVITAQAVANLPGALIVEVVEDSPAAQAGLVVGDIIEGINGEAVATPDELAERIGGLVAGAEVTLDVRRGGPDGEVETIAVTLGSRPSDDAPGEAEGATADEAQGYLGVTVVPVQPGVLSGSGTAWAVSATPQMVAPTMPMMPMMPLFVPPVYFFAPYGYGYAPYGYGYAPYSYGWGMPNMLPYAAPMFTPAVPGEMIDAPETYFHAVPLDEGVWEKDVSRKEVHLFRFGAAPVATSFLARPIASSVMATPGARVVILRRGGTEDVILQGAPLDIEWQSPDALDL